MKTVIEQQLKSVMAAVTEQSNRITSELSANFDAQNAAQSAFNDAMAKVANLRRQADELQAKAILDLDTALTNCGTVGLSIINQLNDGQMITGTPVPARRPRLVQPAPTAKAAQ